MNLPQLGLCSLLLASTPAVALHAAEPAAWTGTVTAVNSNGNRPGRSFTAVDANGQIRIFYISSLSHLDKGDRVELHYRETKTFPLEVTRIRFLPPVETAPAQ